MSGKRKDKRGRLLREGETQSSDGRYRYSYVENGVRKQCYSWKLVKTDSLPKGKRDCVPLRDQEEAIRKAALFYSKYTPVGLTVYDLVKWHYETKKGIKKTTRAGYKTVCRMLEHDSFGSRKIETIKSLEAKRWLAKLQTEDGKSYHSIHTIRGVMRSAFKEASLNEWIPKNPFDDFSLKDAIEKDFTRREALSEEDEKRFMDFIQQDKHFCKYYDGIFILLNTGLRISEFCGLTLNDIDMDKREISINHQLMRVGVNVYCENSAKTHSGNRIIPMEDEVYECFKRIIDNRKKPRKEPVIDGYKGFLFLDKDGNPCLAMHWEHYFQHIVQKYNNHYKDPLPKITPHIMRHTYCTRRALGGMNPKILQYLMGHTRIDITLGYYTTARLNDAKMELKRLKTCNF